MCSHYEAPTPQALATTFGIDPDPQYKLDLWPGYVGPFLRADVDGNDELQLEVGTFGLIPGWSKDDKIARRTYNARSETVAQKPSFRNAWRDGRHCIIPAAAIYEPDWRSGKAVPTRIERSDGEIMGIAGIWERWKSPRGEWVFSYSMLTVNADDHAFMRDYHKPDDEKRMVVILPKAAYSDWLHATPANNMEFLRQYPADRLAVTSPKPLI